MPTPQPVQLLWKDAKNGQVYHLTVDASVQETHTIANEVSEHPVEKGVNIVDHVRALPIQVSIQGVISNTPIRTPLDFGENTRLKDVKIKGAQPTVGSTIGRPFPIAGALLSHVPLPLPADTAVVQGFDPPFDRVKACWNQILKLQADGQLIAITTTLHNYTSMAIESFVANRDAKSGNALFFTLTAKQVAVGKTEAVSVPALPIAKVDTGRKVAAPTEEDLPADSESVMSKLFN